MAGHSKWANIKHSKGAADAKRGRLFTKLAKEIAVSAKMGGGDIDSNPRLRRAITSAKTVSMPKDNIERAIKRGTGELEGVSYEEITFEGYGPGGVAVLVDCMTDNRVRTVAEVRHAFDRGGGNLGEQGCVNWMFETKGELIFPKEGLESEKLQEESIEAGALDIEDSENNVTVYTSFEDFDTVKESLEKAGFTTENAQVTKVPQNTVEIKGEMVEAVLKLLEKLEDNDDVQNVYANLVADDGDLAKYSGG